MNDRSKKPTNGKCYGSIPHLPGSKTGSGDHTINHGQYKLCCVKRNPHDRIIVQEKLDGSCCGVLNQNGELIPLVRTGYTAISSPFEQHHLFHDYVIKNKNRFDFLEPGERVVGEWLAQAHGTKYDFRVLNGRLPPFVVFDVFDANNNRYNYFDLIFKIGMEFANCPILDTPPLIHIGDAISIEEIQKRIKKSNYGGEHVEGVVYRIERKVKKKKVNFQFSNNNEFDVNLVTKWVNPNFEPGKYLPFISGKEEVWNWRP